MVQDGKCLLDRHLLANSFSLVSIGQDGKCLLARFLLLISFARGARGMRQDGKCLLARHLSLFSWSMFLMDISHLKYSLPEGWNLA